MTTIAEWSPPKTFLGRRKSMCLISAARTLRPALGGGRTKAPVPVDSSIDSTLHWDHAIARSSTRRGPAPNPGVHGTDS